MGGRWQGVPERSLEGHLLALSIEPCWGPGIQRAGGPPGLQSQACRRAVGCGCKLSCWRPRPAGERPRPPAAAHSHAVVQGSAKAAPGTLRGRTWPWDGHQPSPPPSRSPGPRLVFNRVNGRRPPTTSPSIEGTQETYTLAHEENVRFVSEGSVEAQGSFSPLQPDSKLPEGRPLCQLVL